MMNIGCKMLLCLCFLVGVSGHEQASSNLRAGGDRSLKLVSFGGTPEASRFPLQLCQGDCDNDSQCADGLICFQRGRGGVPVPGCPGGNSDVSKTDYCIVDDTATETGPTAQASTPVSTSPPNDTATETAPPTAASTPVSTSPPTETVTEITTEAPTEDTVTETATTNPTDMPVETEAPVVATSAPTETNPSCSTAPQCDTLGLEGDCCPTPDGIDLDCCNPESTATAASCSNNAVCALEGLTGECCPTVDDIFLDCCGGE